MPYEPLDFRPHVSPAMFTMQLIAKSSCWHFDAWIYRLADGALLLRVETRAGGRELLTRHDYTIAITDERASLRYSGAAVDLLGASLVTLQDRALRPLYSRLDDMHWRTIAPMAARVPAGYKSRSVALHYVRAPSMPAIDDGAPNAFVYERRSAA